MVDNFLSRLVLIITLLTITCGYIVLKAVQKIDSIVELHSKSITYKRVKKKLYYYC